MCGDAIKLIGRLVMPIKGIVVQWEVVPSHSSRILGAISYFVIVFRVCRVPSTVQMNACKMTGYAELPLGVNERRNVCTHGAL